MYSLDEVTIDLENNEIEDLEFKAKIYPKEFYRASGEEQKLQKSKISNLRDLEIAKMFTFYDRLEKITRLELVMAKAGLSPQVNVEMDQSVLAGSPFFHPFN